MNRRTAIIISSVVFAAIFILAIWGKRGGKKDNVAPVVQEKTAAHKMSAQKLFSLAQEQEAANKLVRARAGYEQILAEYPEYPDIEKAQRKMEGLNMKIIFSPVIIGPHSQYYEVRPGDNLNKIAHRFHTTVGMIKRINGLRSDIIRPRMRLKVWTGKFSILVDKSQNILILKSDDKIVKTYNVATGKNNSTPVGKFRIANKLIDPVWFRPGVAAVVPATSPENVLGSRWMGLDIPGYGIHGTRDNDSLGLQVTEGCVRMSNKDVEELYSIVPMGAEVVIID